MNEEEFFSNTIPEPNSGCLLWLGKYHSQGYGRLCINGKDHFAHRYSFNLMKGKIPDGLELDHLCRVRCCVNPDHLEPVTKSKNYRRGFAPAAINARKTHCIKDHPFEYPNLRVRINGREFVKSAMLKD